jgi:vacuolar-type H+-ATPase subunit I/STV1
MELKHKGLITEGIEQPLELVKFHNAAPFTRRLMSGKSLNNNSKMHIAVHEIKNKLPKEMRKYSTPHAHNCSEWNLILSFDHLVFEIMLDDEFYEVKAPASIYIPSALIHCANVIEGQGFYIALLDCIDYDKSLIEIDQTKFNK